MSTEELSETERLERQEMHFSTVDLWDFQGANAKAQISALSRFRETMHGYPADITSDEWYDLIGVMIDGFQAVLDMDDRDFFMNPAKMAECRDRFRAGMKVYVDRYFSLWD